MIEYEDFSVKIEPLRGDAYPVIVLRSPAGEGRSAFRLPFDPDSLGDLLFDLGHSVRGPDRPPTREASLGATRTRPQQIGDQLFNALFSGPARSLLDQSLGMIRERQRGLRIKLHIDPEDPSLARLASLPWELMYRKETRDFLNLSRYTPILRYLDVQRPYVPLPLQPPLRILVVISSPWDCESLDLAKEQQQIQESWARQQGVAVDFLPAATISNLGDRLAEQPYHVLHYMGHGAFDRNSGHGVLILEDGQDRGAPVDGTTLGILLRDVPSLRLVFLNACETARVTKQVGLDPFAGVAAAMVMAGIPAVVAMQFPITDLAAIRFANRFYPLLARGEPVDYAVAEGRRAIRLSESSTMEWATPVLFMRAPDGVIFRATPAPTGQPRLPEVPELPDEVDEELEKRLQEIYTTGLTAYYLEEWDKARRNFQAIVDLRPGYESRDAAAKLEEAQRQSELEALYAQGQAAMEVQDWPEALAALEKLVAEQTDYRDAARLLERARKERQVAELYAHAGHLHRAAQWQAVINVFAQIQAIDPDSADPEDLLPTAKEKFAEEERIRTLQDLQQRALRAMNAAQWLAARELLVQIQEVEPGFGETEGLLAKTEAELAREKAERLREEKVAGLYEQAAGLAQVSEWQKVLDILDDIQALDPAFDDPQGLATRAQTEVERQARLAHLYQQAEEAQQAGDWPQAILALEAQLAEAPDYRDAQDRLLAAQKQQEAANLYAHARQAHQAQQWQSVIDTFAQLASLDPNCHDPDGLLSSAQEHLAQEQRQARLDDLYSRALHAMDAGHWAEARRLLSQVQETEPGFQDTEPLLAKAQAQIERDEAQRQRQEQVSTWYEQALGLARAHQWRQVLAKMDEIRALEPSFDDSDGITAKAQTQIEREEEEAQRQQELAALYAEAVRLLKAEQYQDALEAWGQVQTLDPRYADRKKVQATARKRLAALARPHPERRLPRWGFVAIGGAVVGILALIIWLSGVPGGGVGTPTGTSAAVAAVTQFDTPTPTPRPTNTTPPEVAPTPAPTRTRAPTSPTEGPSTAQEAQAYVDQGVTLLDQGEYEAAIAEFDQALALGWESAALYSDRAWACREWHVYEGGCSLDQAIADYTKAIELEPENPDYWKLRGELYSWLGNHEAALADHTQAISVDPQRADLYSARSWSYRSSGELEAALADLNEAIELDDQNASYLEFRASLHIDRGQFEAAIRDCDTALELDPEHTWAHITRGRAYDQLGDSTQALTDFDRAVELDPQDSNPYFHRGLFYGNLGQWDKQAADMTTGMRLDPDWPDLWGHRGYAYDQLGQVEEARSDYQQFMEMTKGRPDYQDWRTNIQQWLDDNPITAIATPRPAVQATPLPGRETIPISQMASNIPWLPSGEPIGVQTIHFNTTLSPVNDRRVRQALSQVVNRRTLVDTLVDKGLASDIRPATSFLHRNVLGRDLYQTVGLSYNPDRARQLLAEAGYPGGSGFPRIILAGNEGGASQEVVNLVAEMWRSELGIEVEVQLVEGWENYLDLVRTQAPHAFRLGWTDGRDPSSLGRYHSAHLVNSNLGDNWPYFSSPELDRLLEEGTTLADDPAARQTQYIEAERILCEEEAFIIPLYHMGEANE